MVLFFLIVDYSIPILMIISYPYWKKIASGNINSYSGMRTIRSMKNKENWKKANLLCGKYCVNIGILLIIFVSLMRYIKPVSMEYNSIIITTVCTMGMILIPIFVNIKIK